MRMQPRPALAAELARRCTTARGLTYVRCVWSDKDQCLVVQDLREDRRTWMTVTGGRLRDERGRPRQLDMRDIHAAEARSCGRREELDNWLERAREAAENYRFEQFLNGDVEAKALEDLEDGVNQTIRQWAQDSARQPTQGWRRCKPHGEIVGYCALCEMRARQARRSKLARPAVYLPSGHRLAARGGRR